MVSVARKNTFRDHGRTVLTSLGIAAAVVLILFGLGMANGTIEGMLVLPRSAGADVWVLDNDRTELLSPSLLWPRIEDRVRLVEGVADARRLDYTQRKAQAGMAETEVVVLGLDTRKWTTGRDFPAGAPWELAQGATSDLMTPDAAIVDETLARKLGKLAIGDRIRVDGHPVRIVGVSRRAKSFIYPFVFVSHETAQAIDREANGGPGASSQPAPAYVLVRTAPDANPARVAELVGRRVDDVHALPTERLEANTRQYMLFESGMGVGIGSMAVVGVIVAALISALTLYTATMERVPEYGVLKAIGASSGYILRILVEQVFFTVTLGYALGVVGALGLGALVDRATMMPVVIAWWMLPVGYVAVFVLAAAASVVSARRVDSIDPAMVFRA